jgi:hypothetical protein
MQSGTLPAPFAAAAAAAACCCGWLLLLLLLLRLLLRLLLACWPATKAAVGRPIETESVSVFWGGLFLDM